MHGIWTALVTPFTQDHEIDWVAFRNILKEQKEAGVDGVIPCGTTGESPTLSLSEKKELILTAIKELQGSKTKVIAGTGTNSTKETLELSCWADQQGVAGVILVTPYYNKPSQSGLEAHFRTVADAVSCEVMLYNVPGRTVVSLSPETICRLATHPRIRSVKEATGNVAFTSDILDLANLNNTKIDVLSGDDLIYLPLTSVGARGVVSVASNLIPKVFVELQNSINSGKLAEAQELHKRYYPLFRDLFIEANPVPIKQSLALAGKCKPHVRLPLVELSQVNKEKLLFTLKRCGALQT